MSAAPTAAELRQRIGPTSLRAFLDMPGDTQHDHLVTWATAAGAKTNSACPEARLWARQRLARLAAWADHAGACFDPAAFDVTRRAPAPALA